MINSNMNQLCID